ncbi:hypothetical protein BGZ68_003875 [Mortierella alpina]|nr:hypothetical protein BGZ68_003875 [Mortierella alpina]
MACVSDHPRSVCTSPSVGKSSVATQKTPSRSSGFIRTNVRHASSGTGISIEKPKLVTPKISKYRVDCNTSKVIKRAKDKKPKAAKLTPNSTSHRNPRGNMGCACRASKGGLSRQYAVTPHSQG